MNMDWKNMQHTPEKLIGVQFELKDLFAINVRGITDPNGNQSDHMHHRVMKNFVLDFQVFLSKEKWFIDIFYRKKPKKKHQELTMFYVYK